MIVTDDGRPPTEEEVERKDESCAGQEFHSVPSNEAYRLKSSSVGQRTACQACYRSQARTTLVTANSASTTC